MRDGWLALKKLTFLCLCVLIFLFFCEAITRLAVGQWIIYDVEMLKYSLELKDFSGPTPPGFTHKKNVTTNLMDVKVETNKFGHRSLGATSAQSADVVVMGDSFTFGWGVPVEKTFYGKIAKAMEVPVDNFGHCNYNLEQSVAYYVRQTKKNSPKTAALFYFLNDSEPTPEIVPPALHHHSLFVGLLWSRWNKISAEPGSFVAAYKTLYQEPSEGWENTKKQFLRLKQVTGQSETRLVVFLLPALHQLRPYPFQQEHAIVSQFLMENGIEHHDFQSVFSGEQDPSKYWVAIDDPHPNELAHEKIASKAIPIIKSSVNE